MSPVAIGIVCWIAFDLFLVAFLASAALINWLTEDGLTRTLDQAFGVQPAHMSNGVNSAFAYPWDDPEVQQLDSIWAMPTREPTR